MSSVQRLIAIVVVWLVLAWVSFFSNNPFMPASAIPILQVIYVAAGALTTFIIVRAGGRDNPS